MLYRPQAQNGLWCMFLLPCALYSAFAGDWASSPIKSATLFLSLCFLAQSLLTAYHLLYAGPQRKDIPHVVHGLARTIVSDLFERSSSQVARERRSSSSDSPPTSRPSRQERNLVYLLTLLLNVALFLLPKAPQFHPAVVVFGSGALWTFAYALPRIFLTFPACFTLGEGTLVLQGVLLFLFEASTSLLLIIDNPTTEEGSFSIIGKTGLLACSVLCFIPLLPGLQWCGRSTWFLGTGLIILLGMAVPYLWFALQRNPIAWTLDQIVSGRSRMMLILGWTIGLTLAILKVRHQNQFGKRASTRTRKYFHLIMVGVYTSGIIVDPLLLYLSSIVAFCVFLLLEGIRFYHIQPFGQMIQSSFEVFLDEKDKGVLILTHIYLLVGCSLPLWLTHTIESGTRLQFLSGVLAIGVGDSAASYFGSKFGRIKFPDSLKTVEGTVASIIAQLAFIQGLNYCGWILVTDWYAIAQPVIIVALVEALTTQVDNIVLPLLFYALL